MFIHGFNKLTLLDYPGKLACTIFMGGCNYRCPFCHNASLVLSPDDEPVILEEEIFDILIKRKNMLEGVCISGGEPSLIDELPDFITKIKALGYLVKLDTNGSRPKMISHLLSLNLLDYIAMDIKNSSKKYALTCGLKHMDLTAIEDSIKLIMNAGIPYEFRTTVTSNYHDREDFISIGRQILGADAYYLQAFKDSGALIKNGLTGYSENELNEFKTLLSDYVKYVGIRG